MDDNKDNNPEKYKKVSYSTLVENRAEQIAYDRALEEAKEAGGDENSSWFKRVFLRHRKDAFRELNNDKNGRFN